MSALVKMTIANWPAMLKGLFDANKKSLQFMRTAMKRGANQIKKKFITEQLHGAPGIKAGKLAKGKNVRTYVKGDTHKNLYGEVAISRLLHIHEKGATIPGSPLLFLRRNKHGKGTGEIFATAKEVKIPARLKFRALVAREAPRVLLKVAEEGSRGIQVAITNALKKSI
jgi:hypothetical protein